MENAGYVATGWALTGAVLLAYAGVVARRTRRASQVLRGSGSPWR